MEKSVLRILIEEATCADIDEVCLVVAPGNEKAYVEAAGNGLGSIRFVTQQSPAGYGDAIFRARIHGG